MFEFEEEAPVADEPAREPERVAFTPPTLPLGFLYAEAA